MPDRLGYVVVTFNQASHQPGLNTGADLTDLETAVTQRDEERAETARYGRREVHVVAEVTEFDEAEIGPEIERERAGWQVLVDRARAREEHKRDEGDDGG